MALRVFRQSSLGRKFENSQVPLERPPKMAARWEMLLSPGTRNSALREEMDLTRRLDMKRGSGDGLEGIAEGLCLREPLVCAFLIGLFEGGKDYTKFCDGFAECGEDGEAVFGEDFRPHGGISPGDAGGIAKAATAEFT